MPVLNFLERNTQVAEKRDRHSPVLRLLKPTRFRVGLEVYCGAPTTVAPAVSVGMPGAFSAK